MNCKFTALYCVPWSTPADGVCCCCITSICQRTFGLKNGIWNEIPAASSSCLSSTASSFFNPHSFWYYFQLFHNYSRGGRILTSTKSTPQPPNTVHWLKKSERLVMWKSLQRILILSNTPGKCLIYSQKARLAPCTIYAAFNCLYLPEPVIYSIYNTHRKSSTDGGEIRWPYREAAFKTDGKMMVFITLKKKRELISSWRQLFL